MHWPPVGTAFGSKRMRHRRCPGFCGIDMEPTTMVAYFLIHPLSVQHSYPRLLFVWQEFLLDLLRRFREPDRGTNHPLRKSKISVKNLYFLMVKSLKIGWWNHVIAMCASWNIFFPTRTLLHTYNRHDHHHHRHHHHHHHHHHHIITSWSSWQKKITAPLHNMLTGVIASTLSSWGVKVRHPLWTICWLW